MRRARWADDRGETLVELLVALLIMGTALVAVVGGLATAIVMSSVHREQATVATHMNTYAAQIQGDIAASPTLYDVSCSASYPSYTPNPAAPYSGSVTKVQYWDAAASPPAFVASCPGGVDRGVQLVSLEVHSNDGRVTRSLDIVVRKPCRQTDATC
jgi:type II secretory pathway pseudopilin PulG